MTPVDPDSKPDPSSDASAPIPSSSDDSEEPPSPGSPAPAAPETNQPVPESPVPAEPPSESDAGAEGLPMSATEACVKYANTYCYRLLQCRGEPIEDANGSCAQVSFRCPDLLFSEGSTRTVADVLECAAVYANYDCGALLRGEFPACITKGTRKTGDSCEFASQCESVSCTRNDGTCGQCQQIATAEDDCNDSLMVCPAMYDCNPDGTCVNQAPTAPESSWTAPESNPGADAPIAIGGDCRDAPDRCHPASQCVGGVCQPLGLRGLFELTCAQ